MVHAFLEAMIQSGNFIPGAGEALGIEGGYGRHAVGDAQLAEHQIAHAGDEEGKDDGG
jgi:hypothetical protein